MNVRNHETYKKIQFAEELKGVAMNDGGEELPRKVEEEKNICWEEVRRLRVWDGGEGEDGGGDETTERGDATYGIFCSN